MSDLVVRLQDRLARRLFYCSFVGLCLTFACMHVYIHRLQQLLFKYVVCQASFCRPLVRAFLQCLQVIGAGRRLSL